MSNTKIVQTRVSEDDYKQLEELCDNYDTNVCEYVRHIIKEHLSSKVESTPKHTLANLKRAYKQYGFGSTRQGQSNDSKQDDDLVDYENTSDLHDYD